MHSRNALCGLLVSGLLLFVANANVKAALIFDSFGPGSAFSTFLTVDAAGSSSSVGVFNAARAAARFTVSGSDFNLTSLTLPVSEDLFDATSMLRVSVTTDAGAFQGPPLKC